MSGPEFGLPNEHDIHAGVGGDAAGAPGAGGSAFFQPLDEATGSGTLACAIPDPHLHQESPPFEPVDAMAGFDPPADLDDGSILADIHEAPVSANILDDGLDHDAPFAPRVPTRQFDPVPRTHPPVAPVPEIIPQPVHQVPPAAFEVVAPPPTAAWDAPAPPAANVIDSTVAVYVDPATHAIPPVTEFSFPGEEFSFGSESSAPTGDFAAIDAGGAFPTFETMPDAVPAAAPPAPGLLPSLGSLAATGVPAAPSVANSAATALPAGNPISRSLLFTWASVATLAAAWLWHTRVDPPGHLENLPDDGDLKPKIVSPLESLSTGQLLRLNETRVFGNIEVTPLRIDNGPVRVSQINGQTSPVLQLRLRIKNVSKGQTFHPTDPVFLYPEPEKGLRGLKVFDKSGFTYTFIQPVGNLRDLILPHDVPFREGFQVEGQDFVQLAPGAEFETFVVSCEDAKPQIKGPMIWRVKLRKGMNQIGRGVATVIGVVFNEKDIDAPPPAAPEPAKNEPAGV